MRRLLFLIAALAGLGVAAAPPTPPASGKLSFNRDVRPILSENCFRCHGPDKGNRQANLRLDLRAAAIEAGAIVPGKPGESELVSRIFKEDAAERMPPADSHKALTTAQKEVLKKWIEQGAEYQPHWAYLPPERPTPPAVKDAAWVRNPIDAFVLVRLEAEGIAPSPEADRRTLIRRVSLDLIGLPPTPAEVEAFVADASPNAYEKVVDRLLASPRYGERMATPWLDLVRFADTVGYHGDQNVNIFPYRDYVIDSFNQNKPFDQFTVEQLAGDLVADPTPTQRIATGFNRLNMMTREGGAQPKEYLAKYQADRVRTVAGAWLGSTVGCAECHDHKFDPFTAKDFYSLSAFFADIKQWGVYQDYTYTPNPDLKGWSNEHPWPPELEVESGYLHRRSDRLHDRLEKLALEHARTESGAARRKAWAAAMARWFEHHPTGWAAPRPTIEVQAAAPPKLPAKPKAIGTSPKPAPSAKATPTQATPAASPPAPPPPDFKLEADGRALLLGPAGRTATLRLPVEAGPLAALRLDVLPHGQHKGRLTRGGSNVVRLSAGLNGKDGKARKVAFWRADATAKQPVYRNGHEAIGILGGWALPKAREACSGVWLLDPPLDAQVGDELIVTLPATTLGCVRLSYSAFAPIWPNDPDESCNTWKFCTAEGAHRTIADRTLTLNFIRNDRDDPAAFATMKSLVNQIAECRDGMARTLVTESQKPLVARVLPRGNWQDETGPIVEPATPAFLPGPKPAAGKRLTRLDLAHWLTAPENPLTARVFVNRLWKQLFGVGLSAVLDDLGSQGEWPTHPELLDWLAVEFRASGWKVKHMVKLLVLSNAYRQSSTLRPELKEHDPSNRLLAHQNPRRLEAEFVRDNTLFVAGLLDPEVGGPSAFPYQPKGYYANLQFPDRDYFPSKDERQWRRGLYTHWQRTFLQPMLANFDAPSREECVACRTLANTPQQALTLLNDPTFVEAARVFAANLLEEASRRREPAGDARDQSMLDAAYRRLLARPPKAREAESLLAFLKAQRAEFGKDAEAADKLLKVGAAPPPNGLDAIELAAWTSLCRVLLNLQETITRY